jgi:peptide/nickel transport system permease protein
MTTVNPDELQASVDPPSGGDVVSTGSPWRLLARTFAQNRLAVLGVVLVVVIVLFSFVGPLIDRTDQSSGNLLYTNLHPGHGHLLGTDNSGFDIFGRLMYGGQSSIEVGVIVGVVSTLFGLVYGAISGFFGKLLDGILMRIVDIGLAIPIVFLFIFMAQVFRPSLVLLIILLALVSWLVPARLVRGETLTLRTREYVQAVQVMGGRSPSRSRSPTRSSRSRSCSTSASACPSPRPPGEGSCRRGPPICRTATGGRSILH